jgi:hypothetical protein
VHDGRRQVHRRPSRRSSSGRPRRHVVSECPRRRPPATVIVSRCLPCETAPAGALHRVMLTRKRADEAPARDLYTSPLFPGHARRAGARRTSAATSRHRARPASRLWSTHVAWPIPRLRPTPSVGGLRRLSRLGTPARHVRRATPFQEAHAPASTADGSPPPRLRVPIPARVRLPTATRWPSAVTSPSIFQSGPM